MGWFFRPMGRRWQAPMVRGTVRLWDAATGQHLRALTSGDNFWSVAFSPDGMTLATCSPYKAVWLWDVATGQDIRTLTGHTDPVKSVVFSPDDRTLASASYDGTILLWDVSSRAALQPLAADFDGDGAVGFSDFLQFVAKYGLSWGDAGYDARFDLDGDGDRRVPRLVDLRKKLRPGYVRRTRRVKNRSRQVCIESGNPPPSGGFPA